MGKHNMKKSKEQKFAEIVEQLIDGAKEAKIEADAIRANCHTKKYGKVEFVIAIPQSLILTPH